MSLDLSEDVRNEIEYFGKYTVIPISQSGFDSIMSKTEQLLAKLERLPLEDLLASSKQAVDSANKTLLSANESVIATQSVLESAEQALIEAKTTLQGLQPNSQVYYDLEKNLQELEQTLLMMQPFLQEIRQKPNTLIFSQPPSKDKQPLGATKP